MTNHTDTNESAVRVTVVDDDEMFRESLCRNLRSTGFSVIDYPDGQSALDAVLEGEPIDLIILDWKMPGMNGLDVLQRLREAEIQAPVIFLTVLTDQIYEESALLHGAVDFVEKSRSFTILMKRIELILSGPKGIDRDEAEVDSTVKIGPLALHRGTHRVFWREQSVPLTLNEFLIVDHLASSGGRHIKYREIYDLIYGKDFSAGGGAEGYRANVRAFIKRIREKFKAVDPDFATIENYPGFGYGWRADGEA